MRVVFLIGNGFDLNCGLKSSYNDMYEGYCQEKSKSEVIREFKREINHNISLWSNFEAEIAKYALKVKNEDELLQCVRDFKKYLTKYLLNENRQFSKMLKTLNNHQLIIEEFKNSFENFYINCGFKMSMVKNIFNIKDKLENQTQRELQIRGVKTPVNGKIYNE